MLHCPQNTIRKIIFSVIIFSDVSCAGLWLADPTGDWRVADGVANIRVAECNGSMWGAVSWEKTPGGRDTNNPDVSKKNRPTLGMPTPARHEEEGRGLINGKAKSITPRTDNPTV